MGTRKTPAFKPLLIAATALALLLAALFLAANTPSEFVSHSSAKTRVDASSSIVGGTSTTASNFPWQVLITANSKEFCGGSLIHPMIILTAAHCLVDDYGNYYEDRPGLVFRAYTGRTRVNAGGVELDWHSARVDPRYDAIRTVYDWGFVSLDSPASAPTLKIAGPDELPLWEPGRKATVTGFGDLYDGGPSSTVLQRVTVNVLADSGCSRYGAAFDGTTQLCAGYIAGGRDACQGDSGGPLSVTGDKGARRLIGIVSTGKGCALHYFPGIYSRVAEPELAEDIQSEVELIESLDDFPDAYSGINVIGSQARPYGCAASIKARKIAEQRVESSERALEAARRTGNRDRIEAAKRSLKNAKNRLSDSRDNSERICF